MENQVQEEEAVWKVFEKLWWCDKLQQIKNPVFENVKTRYNFNCKIKTSWRHRIEFFEHLAYSKATAFSEVMKK